MFTLILIRLIEIRRPTSGSMASVLRMIAVDINIASVVVMNMVVTVVIGVAVHIA